MAAGLIEDPLRWREGRLTEAGQRVFDPLYDGLVARVRAERVPGVTRLV